MLITEDLLLRNDYYIFFLPNKKRLFIKECQETLLFDNEYLAVDQKYALIKGYGKWLLFSENQNSFVKDTNELKAFFDIEFSEEKNLTKGFVYVIKSNLGYKIGKSSRIKERLNFFKINLPFEWSVEAIFMVEQPLKVEKLLHTYLKTHRQGGEWFHLNEDLLEKINIYFKYRYNVENLIKKESSDFFIRKVVQKILY